MPVGRKLDWKQRIWHSNQASYGYSKQHLSYLPNVWPGCRVYPVMTVMGITSFSFLNSNKEIYLLEWQSYREERKTKEKFFICWFILSNGQWLSWYRWQPRVWKVIQIPVAHMGVCSPSAWAISAAYPGDMHLGCQHYRQFLNPLHHKANPGNFPIIVVAPKRTLGLQQGVISSLKECVSTELCDPSGGCLENSWFAW